MRKVVFLLAGLATAPPVCAQVVQRWVQRYDRRLNGAYDDYFRPFLAVDASGEVLVTGVVAQPGSKFTRDTLMLKYSGASGEILWEQHGAQIYGGGALLYALALDADGNAFLTGSMDTGLDTKFSTIKCASADGRLLWCEQRRKRRIKRAV